MDFLNRLLHQERGGGIGCVLAVTRMDRRNSSGCAGALHKNPRYVKYFYFYINFLLLYFISHYFYCPSGFLCPRGFRNGLLEQGGGCVGGLFAAVYWQDLGQNWQILNQYFKPYPVCRWAQPAVAACLSVCRQPNFHPTQVAHITVWTFHEGVRLFSDVPSNTEQAQYAISFPIAMAVLKGVISAEDVYSGFNDLEVQDMIGKITLIEDKSYNEVFPAERWAHVRIQMADGTEILSEPHEAIGDSHKTMRKTQFHDKYMNLCEPVWGTQKSRQVLAYIEQLERGSLAGLLALIRS